MAALMLCRQVPRLRFLGGLRKDFSHTRHVNVKAGDETSEQGAKSGALQDQESSQRAGYRLHYSPSTYQNSASSWSQTDNDKDEQCLSAPTPSLWQQNSVSCSGRLSSSGNTLDSVVSKGPEPKTPLQPPHCSKPTTPYVEVEPRAYLKCRPEYASMTLDLDRQPLPIEWEQAQLILQRVTALQSSMEPSHVCQFLTELSCLRPDKMTFLSRDQRLNMLLQYSAKNVRLFTLPQLLEVMQSLVWLDVSSDHTVLGPFENELSYRTNKMSLHQLLLAADLWRCIGGWVPKFLQHLYKTIHLHLAEMGVPEIVQLVYIIGEGRHCPQDLLYHVEKLLMHHMQQLHPEEVGTVCLGLFKSQASISETAVNGIVTKALSFVEKMSDFAMVNVLKYMRFCHLHHRAWLEAMTKEVPRRAPEMGVKGLMHVAMTCSLLHYRNNDILMAIAERVPSQLPYCRSKDYGKLLWSFGTVGFLPEQSPCFYPSLTMSLRRRKAIFQQFPEHLLSGLLGLAFVSQFPEDLIAFALSPDLVSYALRSKKLELKKDYFTLDGAVALELPQWTGPRLSCELREEVEEILWTFAQSRLCVKPEVQEAESALQDLLGGKEFVRTRMILPHTRSIDLEVHLDSSGQPIPVNPIAHADSISPETRPRKVPLKFGRERTNPAITLTEDLLSQLTNKKTTDPLTSVPAVSTTAYKVEPDDEGRLFNTGLYATRVLEEIFHKQSSKGTVKLAIQVSNRNHYCYQSQQLLGLHAMKRRQLKLAGYTVVELYFKEWFPLLRKSRSEKLAYLNCKIHNSL